MLQNPTDNVNISSGNGLVLAGSKPLPEPMLTQISVTIWNHQGNELNINSLAPGYVILSTLVQVMAWGLTAQVITRTKTDL